MIKLNKGATSPLRIEETEESEDTHHQIPIAQILMCLLQNLIHPHLQSQVQTPCCLIQPHQVAEGIGRRGL